MPDDAPPCLPHPLLSDSGHDEPQAVFGTRRIIVLTVRAGRDFSPPFDTSRMCLHSSSRATGAAVHSICEALRLMAAMRPTRRGLPAGLPAHCLTVVEAGRERTSLRLRTASKDVLAAIPRQDDTASTHTANN